MQQDKERDLYFWKPTSRMKCVPQSEQLCVASRGAFLRSTNSTDRENYQSIWACMQALEVGNVNLQWSMETSTYCLTLTACSVEEKLGALDWDYNFEVQCCLYCCDASLNFEKVAPLAWTLLNTWPRVRPNPIRNFKDYLFIHFVIHKTNVIHNK